MVSLPAIIACLGIVFAAIIALIVWNIDNVAVTTVTTQLENNLPQTKNVIETGQQADQIQSSAEDIHHTQQAATKGTFNGAWSFGTPLMIVVIAALAIWKRLS